MQKNAKTPRSHRRAKWIGGITEGRFEEDYGEED